MSSLRFETLTMPAASLGSDNPFPQMVAPSGANAPLEVSPEIPEVDRANFGYGTNRSILPYSIQDGYGRERSPREFRAVVLENEILRATFLPEVGGRLWSLYHKGAERELLYVNPVFQPANLALRNAWFSGGIEWNMSIVGHHPFTCEPLYATLVTDAEGNPVLRMYEWERLRGVIFQIEASLPPGSPVLLVRVRLLNPTPHEIPTYWWSNIAVQEKPGSRVLVPADWAMSFGYGGGLERVEVPVNRQSLDISYPTNIPGSNDFFFRIPDGDRPWIAVADEDGKGLFQTSTARLRGRKLFVWGTDAGGRRWQEFLSEPGHPYVEIQAGLGRTQAECVPMPANADWSWVEAYGLLEGDRDLLHGKDWNAALAHVAQNIQKTIPAEQLEVHLRKGSEYLDSRPGEVFQYGSGWGALEHLRREQQGEAPLGTSATPFPREALGAEQESWKRLLETGHFPRCESGSKSSSWLIQPEWRTALEKAANISEHDEGLLHLGLMYYAAGEIDKAREAWNRSLQQTASPVVLRNLSVLAGQEGHCEERLSLLEAALELAPGSRQLVVEFLQALLEGGKPRRALEQIATLSPELQLNGRIRMMAAQASLQIGELEKVGEFFDSRVEVADLKEGDNALTDLWFEYQRKRLSTLHGALSDSEMAKLLSHLPPPPHYEFRMRIPSSNC